MAYSRPCYFYPNDKNNKKDIHSAMMTLGVDKDNRGNIAVRPMWAMFEREFNGIQLVEIEILRPAGEKKVEITMICLARKDDGTWFQCNPELKPDEISKKKPKLDNKDIQNLGEYLGKLSFQEKHLLNFSQIPAQESIKFNHLYPTLSGITEAIERGNQIFKQQDSKHESPEETKKTAAQKTEQAIQAIKFKISQICTDYYEKNSGDKEFKEFYQALTNVVQLSLVDYKKSVVDVVIEDYKINNGKKSGFLGLHGNKIKMTDEEFEALPKKDDFANLLKAIRKLTNEGIVLEKSISHEFR